MRVKRFFVRVPGEMTSFTIHPSKSDRLNASALISFGTLSQREPEHLSAPGHVALVNVVRLNAMRENEPVQRSFCVIAFRDTAIAPAAPIGERKGQTVGHGFYTRGLRNTASIRREHQPCRRFHEHVVRFMSCGVI